MPQLPGRKGDFLSRAFGIGTPQQQMGPDEQMLAKLRQGAQSTGQGLQNIQDNPASSIGRGIQMANMANPNPLTAAPIEAGAQALIGAGQGQGLGKILGGAAIAGATELIPFGEAGKALKKIPGFNSLKERAGKNILKQIGDSGIETMVQKIRNPETFKDILNKFNIDKDIIKNHMDLDIMGNYKTQLDFVKDKDMIKMFKEEGRDITKEPVEYLRKKARGILKGFRENSVRTVNKKKFIREIE